MKQASFKEAKKAFTLIELLVVIAIIGILATISVLALSNARAKSRDAKRAGDMKQVQTALELFFNDNNRYPTTEEWNTGKIYSTTTGATSTYMQIIPTAPTPADGNCGDKNTVIYTPSSDWGSYNISFCLGNTTGTLTPGPKCLTPGGIMDVDCSVSVSSFICGTSNVSYEGEVYPTVLINSQCWLAKNLNVGTMVAGSVDQGDYSGGIQKYCYNDHEINPDPSVISCVNGANCGGCDTDGGLYQWHMAVGKNQSCNNFDCAANPTDSCCLIVGNDICPDGWHIPSYTEFTSLEAYLSSAVGTKLKSSTPDWDGDNSSGFSALQTGRHYTSGPFNYRADNSYFWSSSYNSDDPSYAWRLYLWSGYSGIDLDGFDRSAGFSVRCIKD